MHGVAAGQTLPCHHVVQYRDVRGYIHGLVAEQTVQLLFERQHDGGHHALYLLHGAGDVLAGHALTAQLVVAAEQLQRGGQIVGHELPDLRQLLRVRLHIVEYLAADLLQPVDLAGDSLVLYAVVQRPHGLDGRVALGDGLVQVHIAGAHRLLRYLHGLGHIPAEHPGDQRHHGGSRRRQQEVSHLIQRKQQCVQHPRHRRGVDGCG